MEATSKDSFSHSSVNKQQLEIRKKARGLNEICFTYLKKQLECKSTTGWYFLLEVANSIVGEPKVEGFSLVYLKQFKQVRFNFGTNPMTNDGQDSEEMIIYLCGKKVYMLHHNKKEEFNLLDNDQVCAAFLRLVEYLQN